MNNTSWANMDLIKWKLKARASIFAAEVDLKFQCNLSSKMGGVYKLKRLQFFIYCFSKMTFEF